MIKNDKDKLLSLLDEYYDELNKTCEGDCYNCEMGVLEGYGYDYSCAINVVTNNIESELYTNSKR